MKIKNDYDWFLKVDDDSYVVMENLRYLLLAHGANEPVYFGCKFVFFARQGYMSGGSGYVLSREALRLFVNGITTNTSNCRPDGGGDEDGELGMCLERVGVKAGDSRDATGRHRFIPFALDEFLMKGEQRDPNFWFHTYSSYPIGQVEIRSYARVKK